MHTKVATVVFAFALAAAPAALAKGSVTIEARLVLPLHALSGQITPIALEHKDKLRSCQAAAPRSRVRLPGSSSAGETERRASTVACEQPPLSNLNLSGGLKAAEAGALASAG
jgi:hypothetical protein